MGNSDHAVSLFTQQMRAAARDIALALEEAIVSGEIEPGSTPAKALYGWNFRSSTSRPRFLRASTSIATTDVGPTTIGRAKRACALSGTMHSASTCGQTMGPPALKLYAVDPVGVQHAGVDERRELAEAAEDAKALAQAHNILGVLAGHLGDHGNAVRHLERSLALAERLDDPSSRVAALNNLALARGAAGELDRAVALAETALAVCASHGDRHRQAALHNNLADLLQAMGRGEAAMAHLKQAVTIFTEVGAPGSLQPEIWKLVEW